MYQWQIRQQKKDLLDLRKKQLERLIESYQRRSDLQDPLVDPYMAGYFKGQLDTSKANMKDLLEELECYADLDEE